MNQVIKMGTFLSQLHNQRLHNKQGIFPHETLLRSLCIQITEKTDNFDAYFFKSVSRKNAKKFAIESHSRRRQPGEKCDLGVLLGRHKNKLLIRYAFLLLDCFSSSPRRETSALITSFTKVFLTQVNLTTVMDVS